MTMPIAWNYDRAERRADGLVHLAGVTLAVIGTAALIVAALRLARPLAIFGASVYGFCLVATLAISALYNMWPVGPGKWLLRRFDHAGIFLLIAGTYTPLVLEFGPFARRFLIVMWCVAALGMVLKLTLAGRFDRLAVIFYLALGWSGVYLFGAMTDALSPLAVGLILAGGAAYSSGVIFHLWEKLRFQNAIWHGFVLAGALCHYGAVFVTVVTMAGRTATL